MRGHKTRYRQINFPGGGSIEIYSNGVGYKEKRIILIMCTHTKRWGGFESTLRKYFNSVVGLRSWNKWFNSL